MKFLVLQQFRQIPVDLWAKLLPAHYKYLDGLEKKGKVEVSYHLIGHQRNMLVVNADSDEELTRIVSEDPLFFHSEREVYPLTTREAHKRHLKQIIGR
jgi:muconolactone delta-isomerase